MAIEKHQKDYKPEIWKQYSEEELWWWTNLLLKRADHRTNERKREKDIYDAKNYHWMLGQKLLNK